MPETRCRSCGTPYSIAPPMPRDAECGSCGADLRSCVNCRHYDPRLHNSCRETEADPVEDRRRRNFCEYFDPSREPWVAATGEAGRNARAGLDRLFGGPPAKPAPSGSAREKLENLFKKPPAEQD